MNKLRSDEKRLVVLALIPILIGLFFGPIPVGYILVGYGLFCIAFVDLSYVYREIKEWRQKYE